MVHHREIKSFIVAQGSWSLRGPVNLLYDVTELQGIKIPQFSQFCLFFQRLKVPFLYAGYIAEYFHVVVEGLKGCLLQFCWWSFPVTSGGRDGDPQICPNFAYGQCL